MAKDKDTVMGDTVDVTTEQSTGAVQNADTVRANEPDPMEMRPVTEAKMSVNEWARTAGISQAGAAALIRRTKANERRTATDWMELYQEELNRPA